jgi:hypothetical protein
LDDFRLHSALCPRGRPARIRRLDVRTDYGAFPVWTWFTLPARGVQPAREVHGAAGPAALGLSGGLASALRTWATWHDDHQPAADRTDRPVTTDEELQKWLADGRALARRLAEETGTAVVYLWPSEGRDPDCPHCGTRAR